MLEHLNHNLMKNIICLFFAFLIFSGFSTQVVAQQAPAADEPVVTQNLWKTLSRITYKKEYDEMMGFKVDVPVFSKDILDLESQEVTVKGYIIPVEGYKSHKEFVFSAFPYNMCFFCGGAGPETVMEVTALEPVKYSADAITIKGKLQLNSNDINRLIYGLVDVTVVKE